ncbi:MAG: protease inhibitor I42 family protein [Casimicrobiaceae bacterium]
MTRATLAVTALLAGLAGCQSLTVENPFHPAPLAVRLDAASTAPVSVSRGRTLVVTLDANVTTGYRWEALPGFAPALVQVGTADYSAPVAAPGPVGAPGTMTFRFLASAPGSTTLELAYRRPFEPSVAPAKTVRYEVTVR